MDEVIENAFRKTTKILFGTALTGLEQYKEWLLEHVEPTLEASSVVSGEPVYAPSSLFFADVLGNMVTMDESLKLGEGSISEEQAGEIRLSNASDILGRLRTTSPDVIFDRNSAITRCAAYMGSHYCMDSSYVGFSKYVAYCFWPRESEYVFGSVLLFSSSFCINCYHSTNLARCFELDNCSDCYFCHNCENLSDCMFCFNTKAKKYAIGNVEVGKEEYERIKKLILGDLLNQLETKKKLGRNIYNL
ncbi:TPA: hypothetical protein EYP38_05635 [Candidatus Micrarchaeota archaeon]|nr:hypothetical protein [Candidatus Micrarchaeota archaeon]